MLPVTIEDIRTLSPTVKQFVLAAADPGLSFHAGQWLDLYAPVDGELAIGGYSITSSPLRPRLVELAVRAAREHPATRFLHERARVGDELYVDGGHGACVLDPDLAGPVVLVAGGIGITPLISMVRYAHEARLPVEITLLYSARTAGELLFREELERLAAWHPGMRCTYTITGDPSGRRPGDRTGRIDAAMIRAAGLDPRARYYLCGPPAMIDELAAVLLDLGVPAPQVRFEKWW